MTGIEIGIREVGEEADLNERIHARRGEEVEFRYGAAREPWIEEGVENCEHDEDDFRRHKTSKWG